MANILSKQYKSVFSTPKEDKKVNNVGKFFETTEDHFLHDIDITEEEILKTLKGLPNNSSAGPDGIPTRLLKELANDLTKPLLILFRHSLDTGSPLETPYKATVTPIHKGGDKASPQKYRPVCLTSHIVKVLERILRKHIVDHLEQSNLMNKNQHGFRSKHSTLSQLIAFYDQVINKLDKGSTIDAIYIDFAKAFDTVDHGILLHKIRHKAKIAGKIGVWIHNFLSKRVQQVVVNGELSEEVLVTSGVPQGTVLGPVLFLIMIADIDNDVESSHVSMYADDTRIMKQISKESDEENLKYDLSTIYDWCNENNMKFNGDKFELIVFTTKRNEFNEKDYKSPDGKKIEEKSNLKDLGIQLSGNLKFTEHIDTVISKAQKMTGWILCIFNTR